MIKFNSPQKVIILFILSILPLLGFAQKVTFDNVKVKYTQLPLYPLFEEIKTYETHLKIEIPDEMGKPDQLDNQYLKIQGYKKIKEGGDLIIDLVFGKFGLLGKELITDEVYNINAGENMTGYFYKIHCAYPVTLTVITGDSKEILRQEVKPDKDILNFDFGKWEYSVENLNKKFNEEKEKLLLEKQEKHIKSVLNQAKNILNSNYGYPEKSEKIKIALCKGKKFNYQDIETAFVHTEKAFKGLTNQNNTDLIHHEFNTAIEIWKKAIIESEGGKKSRISPEIKMMLLYNCAVANLWMNNFEKARKDLAEATNLVIDKTRSSHQYLLKELKENLEDKEKRYLANLKD
ncbi:MAG: hypothetical protein IMY71_13770 [Bacteroidetes bacterium]|nr:hypothetical protein [Bacteroidota bacterium]